MVPPPSPLRVLLLGAGEHFGTLASLSAGEKKRSFTATTVGECEFAVINRIAYNRILKKQLQVWTSVGRGVWVCVGCGGGSTKEGREGAEGCIRGEASVCRSCADARKAAALSPGGGEWKMSTGMRVGAWRRVSKEEG